VGRGELLEREPLRGGLRLVGVVAGQVPQLEEALAVDVAQPLELGAEGKLWHVRDARGGDPHGDGKAGGLPQPVVRGGRVLVARESAVVFEHGGVPLCCWVGMAKSRPP
jgi:hypothetical protein